MSDKDFNFKTNLLVRPTGKIYLNLSSPQNSALGRIIGYMYCETNITDLFEGLYSGYPHNGGLHSLSFTGEPDDVIAALELMLDLEKKFDKNYVKEGYQTIRNIIDRIKILDKGRKRLSINVFPI